MATYGQLMKRNTDDVLTEVVKISGTDHTLDQIGALVKDLGGELEVFLKEVIHQSRDRKMTLEIAINNLSRFGIGASDLDNLHRLRLAYNGFKHDARYSMTTFEVISMLSDASKSIEAVISAGVGTTNARVVKISTRMFWICAWDHFLGGDTEVHIVPPALNVWLPPTLEVIYIEMSDWNKVLNDLSHAGKLYMGRSHLPESFWDDCIAEDDFLNAGVFEGEYRVLISTLAMYEKKRPPGRELLPFLERQNNSSSMWSSTLHAAGDVAMQAQMPLDAESLTDLIVRTAAHEYAAPVTSVYARKYSEQWANLLLNIKIEDRSKITGPVFVDSRMFENAEKDALAIKKDYFVLIDGEYRIVAKLGK